MVKMLKQRPDDFSVIKTLVSSQPYKVSKYAINTPYNPTL